MKATVAPVRILTVGGLAVFRKYLDGGPWADEPPPSWLLSNDEFSHALAPPMEIVPRKFRTKFEMGMEVCTAAGEHRLPTLWPMDDLWASLSLAFCQSTFPVRDGKRFVGSPSRHLVTRVPGRLQDQGHRHLVKGAAVAVSRFGVEARVLMGLPHEQTKIEEQIMSRKRDMGLASSKELVRAAYQLYYDQDKNVVKRGAKSTGAGSIMRLIEVLSQLDVNFDVPSLEATEILALLPKEEFGKFLPSVASNS